MSEDERMKSFKENPELFRVHILNAFRECTENIRQEMTTIPHLSEHDLPEHLRNVFMTTIDKQLDDAFKNAEITNLRKTINEMEKSTPDAIAGCHESDLNFISRQPATGIVDNLEEKEKALQKRKEQLLLHIDEADVKAEHLMQLINTKRNNMYEYWINLHKHKCSFD